MSSLAITDFLIDGIEPETSKPGVWLVRIKPYHPQLGHVLRRLSLMKHKFKLHEEKGWRELVRPSRELLEELALTRQHPNVETTPLALDICTVEEAKQIEEAEERRRQQRRRATVDDAGALRTADLPSSKATRRDRLKNASDERASALAGDVETLRARRAMSLTSTEKIDAEIDRLQRRRAKLASQTTSEKTDAEAPSEEPDEAREKSKPRRSRRRSRRDEEPIGD